MQTAVIGLANSLQFEARKKKVDIKVNTIIPQVLYYIVSYYMQMQTISLGRLSNRCHIISYHITQADTRMTRDFGAAVDEKRKREGKKVSRGAPPEIMARMAPAKVSAMVAWLAHKDCQHEATIHEAGAGYFAQLRWERSAPLFATELEGLEGAPVPENVRDGQATLNDFTGDASTKATHPIMGDGSMGAPNALEFVFGHLKKSRL